MCRSVSLAWSPADHNMPRASVVAALASYAYRVLHQSGAHRPTWLHQALELAERCRVWLTNEEGALGLSLDVDLVLVGAGGIILQEGHLGVGEVLLPELRVGQNSARLASERCRVVHQPAKSMRSGLEKGRRAHLETVASTVPHIAACSEPDCQQSAVLEGLTRGKQCWCWELSSGYSTG